MNRIENGKAIIDGKPTGLCGCTNATCPMQASCIRQESGLPMYHSFPVHPVCDQFIKKG